MRRRRPRQGRWSPIRCPAAAEPVMPEFHVVTIEKPPELNVILGQSHFIKL
jgi:hypothetical protein